MRRTLLELLSSITDIPADSWEEAQEYRIRLVEELAEFDEEVMEKYLGEEILPRCAPRARYPSWNDW